MKVVKNRKSQKEKSFEKCNLKSGTSAAFFSFLLPNDYLLNSAVFLSLKMSGFTCVKRFGCHFCLIFNCQ